MKWLLDEMLPAATCRQLIRRGHDAVSVYDRDLGGAEDARVFHVAVSEQRIMVTENFADYAVLLEQCISRGAPCVPVVFVRKTGSSARGALAARLAKRLDDWAKAHPDPYVGPHWA
jgi:predicted nuclease of predicted toxin-antitoxin system